MPTSFEPPARRQPAALSAGRLARRPSFRYAVRGQTQEIGRGDPVPRRSPAGCRGKRGESPSRSKTRSPRAPAIPVLPCTAAHRRALRNRARLSHDAARHERRAPSADPQPRPRLQHHADGTGAAPRRHGRDRRARSADEQKDASHTDAIRFGRHISTRSVPSASPQDIDATSRVSIEPI